MQFKLLLIAGGAALGLATSAAAQMDHNGEGGKIADGIGQQESQQRHHGVAALTDDRDRHQCVARLRDR